MPKDEILFRYCGNRQSLAEKQAALEKYGIGIYCFDSSNTQNEIVGCMQSEGKTIADIVKDNYVSVASLFLDERLLLEDSKLISALRKECDPEKGV